MEMKINEKKLLSQNYGLMNIKNDKTQLNKIK